ncbi:MAG: deoxyribose-phosphate aldolase, partial [Muribaculaceae bacterium]
MDKYQQVIESSKVTSDDAKVKIELDKLFKEHLDENRTEDVYKLLFNCIDLTTLSTTDSTSSVAKFTERVNAFDNEYPQYKNVAAICVYPN